ncbi:MAG: 3TM-type holin [Candidatus Nitrosotenuis sp.]
MTHIFSALNILKPVRDLIAQFKLAPEEKAKLEQHYTDLILDYETKLSEYRTRVLLAEATGSWLQRNWRPLTMLVFVFVIAWNYIIAPLFDRPLLRLPDQLWTVFEIGFGGYIAGRSLEKISALFAKK